MRGAKAGLDSFGGATNKVSGALEGHKLSLGKVERALGSYAARAIGANDVTRELSLAFGGMAVGGGPITAALVGLAAVIAVYEHLTAAAREAKKAQDDLIKSLGDANAKAALGPEPDLVLQTNAQRDSLMQQRERRRQLLKFGVSPDDDRILTLNREIAVSQHELEDGEKRLFTARMAAGKPLEAVTVKARDFAALSKKAQDEFLAAAQSSINVFDELASHGIKSGAINQRLIADYGKVAEQIRQMGTASGPAMDALLKLRDALAANLVVSQAIARESSTGTVLGLVGKTLPGVGFTPDLSPRPSSTDHLPTVGGVPEIVHVQTAIERQTQEAAQHAQALQDAVRSSAQVIGNAVVMAVNIGGGGRGSQIGGALAGGLGAALGTFSMAGKMTGSLAGAALGSAVPIVGTIVGGLIGSAIGGLFDHHKKSVDNNTAALQANTAALLLNTPAGFKVERYRYTASDAKAMAAAARLYASRGGAPILGHVG